MRNKISLNKIHGPVLSVITPFLKNEKIDYKSLYKYLDYYYVRGCKVFYIMAYNSRLTLMTPKEIETFNIKIIRYLKSKYKDVFIISAEGVEKSTQVSIKLCNKFYKTGADMGSLIFGEKYYFDDQIYRHFKTSSSSSGKHVRRQDNACDLDSFFYPVLFFPFTSVNHL